MSKNINETTYRGKVYKNKVRKGIEKKKQNNGKDPIEKIYVAWAACAGNIGEVSNEKLCKTYGILI